ncbi:MAG: GNVR domain-containing protein [bacterium]|nr:GNVR domain-containing protein [bacterium]
MLDQNNAGIREYYQIFLRNRKLFLAPFVVVFCLVSLSILFFPKVYESKTVVRVQKKQPNPITDDRLVREEKLTARLKTLQQMVLSRPLLSQTIRKLNLDKDVRDKEDMEKLLGKIRGRVSIKVKGDELFSVAYEDSNPEKAMHVVSTIVNNFIDENLSMKRDEAFTSVDFIQKQMELYTEKLEQSEEALRLFKQAHLEEMPGVQNATLVQLERLRDSLAETNIKLQEAYEQRRWVQRQLSSEKPMVVSMKTGEAASVDQKIRILEYQLSQLLANYTEKHPDVVRIRLEIDRLRTQGDTAYEELAGRQVPGEVTTLNPIHQKLKEQLNSINISIGTLQSKKAILESKIVEYETKAVGIPNQEKELAGLKRDYDVNARIYDMLLMRYEEARISKQLEFSQGGTRFHVIEPAIVPIRPIKPNVLHFLGAAMALGCGAGASLIMIKEYMDTSTRGVRETESVYNLPVLATVPLITTERELELNRIRQRRMVLSSFLFVLGVVGAVAVALFRYVK